MNLRQGVKRAFWGLLLGFVLLFAFRLAFSYQTTPATPQKRTAGADVYEKGEGGFPQAARKSNYASEKWKQLPAIAGPAASITVDQKYEKTAVVVSATSSPDSDDARVRGMIVQYNGIIQFEQSSGGGGAATTTHMLIGVHPSSFDEFCREIRTVGELQSFNVTKSDKTNEFLDLKAQRASLENSRAALVELKKRNGNVEEFINLQYRILELDRELQTLGVRLGDFDEVNEFCSVRLTLYTVREWWTTPPTLLYRLMRVFVWTAGYYCLLLGILFLALLSAFLAVTVLDKIVRLSLCWRVNEDKGGSSRNEPHR